MSPQMVTSELAWKRELPTTPGYYLRRNPPASHIVRQHLTMIKGALWTVAGDGHGLPLADWRGARRFWWFGPIPSCPWELGE